MGVANRGLNKTLPQRLKAAFKKTGLPAEVIPGTQNLNPAEAEAVEQAIIKIKGRIGIDEGGTLINKLPGINVNPANIAKGIAILKNIGLAGI
ncbi:MAG: hypothetical protein ACJ8FY_16675 [Gemmataceae bacterium]